MKETEFKNAIIALGVDGLEIDEFKMTPNSDDQVRQANGHTKELTLLWDEFGRAFSTPINQKSESFVEFGSGKVVPGRRLKRDTSLDLKFDEL